MGFSLSGSLPSSRPGIAAAAPARTLRLLGDDQVDGPIGADRQDFVVAPDIGVGALMLHVRSVSPDPGHDRLAGLRVFGDLAWQREQAKRQFQIDIAGRSALGNGGAFGLLAILLLLAELHEGAEAPVADADFQTGLRIRSQNSRPRLPALRHHRRRERKAGGCSGIRDNSSSR